MIRKTIALTLLVAGATAAMPPPSSAQHLYNKDRDELAQEAQKLAEELETGALFDKQLKNLDAVSKRDVEIQFLGASRTARAAIDRFTTWKDVGAVVNRVGLAAPATVTEADAKKALAELKGKIAAARAALDELKKAVAAPDDAGVSSVLGSIGELTSLQEYLEKISEKLPGGLKDESKEIGKAVDTLTGLYKRYTERLEAIKKLSADLEGLKVPLQAVALQALLVDEEHWKSVAAINARREAEQGDVTKLVNDFWARAERLELIATPGTDQNPPELKNEAIVATVNRISQSEKREDLADVFLALYGATALATRGSIPAQLAELRLAQEEHRYSIRRSAVFARAYEVTLSTGTKRLALYHKGGIKPELVAQIVQAIATLAIPPAILAR